jgi:hypothetical protein
MLYEGATEPRKTKNINLFKLINNQRSLHAVISLLNKEFRGAKKEIISTMMQISSCLFGVLGV